jgi:GTP-binding protein
MVEYLRHYGLAFTVVATKADKISRAASARHIQAICRALVVQPWEVIPFSAENGAGREKILDIVERFIPSAEPAGE